MKYLVLTRTKDAILMVPEEQRKRIREGSIAYIKKYQKLGKCKDVYMDADMMGSVSIWEWDGRDGKARWYD